LLESLKCYTTKVKPNLSGQWSKIIEFVPMIAMMFIYNLYLKHPYIM